MSNKSSYVKRNQMLNAARWAFMRDDTDHDQRRAEELINFAFDQRPYTEIPLISVENEFTIRGESELFKALVESVALS